MEINKNKLNVIAFYLPQYHSIPENDKAYGNGFTEWTNMKKAKPLYEGHRQPRIPKDNNYYCLLDNGKTMEWQAKLAKDNGIFGFCYYHYYFSNGKKLLEKPLEEMLLNKKIDIPFCLCWANENWTKRWDGGNNEVIAKQDYDKIDEIKEHVKYLVKFFKDERYITLDGKPILLLYRPGIIPNMKNYIKEMRRCFSLYGYPEVNIIIQQPFYYLEGKNLSLFDYYIQYEPSFTITRLRPKANFLKKAVKKVLKLVHLQKIIDMVGNAKFKNTDLQHRSYDDDWKAIINYKNNDSRMIEGGFVDWDNTPRVKTGIVYDGANPQKFENYFSQLCEKVRNSNKQQIIFLTAWNEWCEGAYLEPDEDFGTKYLEAVKKNIK